MKHKSVLLLRSTNHYLLQALEVMNLIDEDDYQELVYKTRAKKKSLRKVCENIERGSVWLTIFFLLELVDEIVDEK